ncbi:MAG: DUF6567 family protein [Salinivirgaceae bacterium]|nr:hypothetical protein [Bacteroidales bacterium]
MRKLLLLLIGTAFLFSGCAVHSGLTFNTNNHVTQVVLSKNNYVVIDSVRGESEAIYVFGIGGFLKEALIAEAKADMLSKADIIGGSRAIINETVEIKHSLFPVIRLYKVTVSGHVIEFTE